MRKDIIVDDEKVQKVGVLIKINDRFPQPLGSRAIEDHRKGRKNGHFVVCYDQTVHSVNKSIVWHDKKFTRWTNRRTSQRKVHVVDESIVRHGEKSTRWTIRHTTQRKASNREMRGRAWWRKCWMPEWMSQACWCVPSSQQSRCCLENNYSRTAWAVQTFIFLQFIFLYYD